MDKTELLSAFNNHLNDFFMDVSKIFPDNSDIKVAHTTLITIRKINPKLVIKIWMDQITNQYRSEIEAGDINFFIERSYTEDLNNIDQASIILEKIDTLRDPIRKMGDNNKKKTTEYIQNLTKICDLYYK
jgi:hypothetical protein